MGIFLFVVGLASRGMPTVILEDHLREIDCDVGMDDRSRQQRATGFRATVARFRGERDCVLPATARRALADRWQKKLSSCAGTRVPGAIFKSMDRYGHRAGRRTGRCAALTLCVHADQIPHCWRIKSPSWGRLM